MRLFGRKSKWDHVRDAASEILTDAGASRLTKVMLGVVGGAVAATAVSAAVSSVRHQGET
jgi:hypothetical protein